MSIQPFIDRLKEAIEQSSATQGTIADHCGVSRQSVTNWKNTGQISRHNLQMLSEVTGYRYVWLKEGTGPKRFSDKEENLLEYKSFENEVREPRPDSDYIEDEASELIRSIRYAMANRKLTNGSVKALAQFFNALVDSK